MTGFIEFDASGAPQTPTIDDIDRMADALMEALLGQANSGDVEVQQ